MYECYPDSVYLHTTLMFLKVCKFGCDRSVIYALYLQILVPSRPYRGMYWMDFTVHSYNTFYSYNLSMISIFGSKIMCPVLEEQCTFSAYLSVH